MESSTQTQASPPLEIAPLTLTDFARKVAAEMFGTYALVLAGCGAVMSDSLSNGNLGHLGVSLTFGLVITAMILATGHVSGAHFNPAVTVAFASIGRFPWRQVPGYIAGQSVAAVLAAATLRGLLGVVAGLGATVPTVATGPAFGFEVVLTFFLMFVITAVATDDRAAGQMAAVAIGGTVALSALWGGPLTGASMNPARSLGPALLSGEAATLSWMWLYTIAPIVGAVAGAWAYHTIRCGGQEQDARGCC